MQLILNILVTFGFYILLGSGFYFGKKSYKFTNFAFGDLVILSGFICYWVFDIAQFGFDFHAFAAYPVWIVLFLTSFLSVFVSILVFYKFFFFRFIFKPSKSLELIISCISISTVIVSCLQIFFGNSIKMVKLETVIWEINKMPNLIPNSIFLTNIQLITLLLALGVTLIIFLVKNSTIRLYLKAFSANQKSLQALGVNIIHVNTLIILVTSLLVYLAGFVVLLNQNLQPSLGIFLTLKAYVINSFTPQSPSFFGTVVIGSAILAVLEGGIAYFLGGVFAQGFIYILMILLLGFWSRSNVYNI